MTTSFATRRALLQSAVAVCGLGAAGAPAQTRPRPAADALPLSFGVLPVGGAVDSRSKWEPLLQDLGSALGRRVSALSVPSYEAMERAIEADQVDIAYLSGKLALNAVLRGRMQVVASVERDAEQANAHQALLLMRKAPPLNSLEALLAAPERWRIARGGPRSVSGYIVPQLQLFLPRGVDIETRFAGELVGTHQENALAVANGDVDVATNNSTDLERFRQQFPVEAARLQVVWRSEPTPPAQILVRTGWTAAQTRKLQDFLTTYGRGGDARSAAQRAVLKGAHANAIQGYALADNSVLVQAARQQHELARQQARSGQWVSEAARQQRLARLDAEYARQAAWLQRDPLRAGK
ncbi:Phosphate-import protein PhnD [Xylophilus ampelinus]|nr:phosphate/phosphite/phosphonate ABC transporter substrate-binding protein [Variovorax sp.]VTY37698.1 Phosphate-import protein PhnD [Xylophilus ampelinus]